MQTIALPKNVELHPGENPNEGQIIIEPLSPGYGITLGNSLRRVLISSLPGAATIGVKIEGANHEFSSLQGLKEDVLEFILKLKKLRLKIYSDEIVKLELEVHGKKEIKASDIKKNSLVEVVNPDLVLGSITDMAGNLKLEIFANKGMGYEIVENREKREKEIGYIEMDSIYSPVLAAGIKIENVRVGKLTNYEKLILDIKTDGTITPESAFNESINILLNQFKALQTLEKAEVVNKIGEEVKEIAADEIPEVIEESRENEELDIKKKRGRPKKSE
jgi:DNA-directed RNA polymerase subunit alpha